MKKIAVLLSVIMLVSCLAGCGSDKGKTVLNVYNWGEFIDESVLKDFEKKYPDIKINYEKYADNETMYTKIKNGGVNYDVLFPSDYMIARLIEENMLAKLDFSNIPNYKYIDEKYKNWSYDPRNEYSVPYMFGFVGILYDKTKIDGSTLTWDSLFAPKYEKSILIKNDMRDMLGIALKTLGYSMNSTDENELEQAKQKLIEQKPNVLGRVGDEGMDKMIAGEADMAVMYGGDALTCMRENENLDFVLPKEGVNYFVDAMVIPANAEHKKEAELFINFMCETDIALKNAEEIGYSTPQTEAYKLLPEDMKTDFAYPPQEVFDKAEVYTYLGDKTELYDRIWTEFLASI